MAVISALRTAGRTVVRNPVILLVTALYSIVQLPQLLAQVISPLLASVISLVISLLMIFITPFFQAGLIGMANEGIDGRTRVGTLVSEGKEHYVPVLGVYLLILAVSFAVGIAVVFVAIAGFGAVLASGSDLGLGVLAIFALLGLLAFGALLLTFFFFQFYVQAIVIENIGAVAGLKHSYRCVRAHILSTVGYVLLAVLVGSFFGLLGALSSIFTSPSAEAPAVLPEASPAIVLGAVILFIVLSGVLGGFMATYSVAFYREIRVPVSS